MASIYKRKYNKVVNGKKVKKQSKSWYVKYRDADGIELRVKGYPDKEATRQMAARLEKESALAQEGVVDRYKEHRARRLSDHLEDFQQSLLAKGRTAKQAKQVTFRAKRVFEGCKCHNWNDIQPSKVERQLAELHDSGTGISVQTYNHYLKAIKQFANWMVRDGRAPDSPVKHLKCKTVKKVVDEVHPRRVLEIDELRHLLTVTKSSGVRFGMSGFQRYVCYRVAAETGLRAKELRSLSVNSFDLEACTVQVSGNVTKNRCEAVVPLRPDTVEELRQLISGKMPQAQVFKIPEKAYQMIKADLAAAGIPYIQDGLYFDFHALRHQTVTLLASAGVHPKVAQAIMRHSDINLTLSRYTHTLTGQEAKAIESLPDLSAPIDQQQVATGTDNRVVDTRKTRPEKLTPQLTPKSTPTAFSDRNRLSVDGTGEAPSPKKAPSPKDLKKRNLDINRTPMSQHVMGENEIRLRGFEPLTFGSVDRRSIQLSYRRNSLPCMRLRPQGSSGPHGFSLWTCDERGVLYTERIRNARELPPKLHAAPFGEKRWPQSCPTWYTGAMSFGD